MWVSVGTTFLQCMSAYINFLLSNFIGALFLLFIVLIFFNKIFNLGGKR